MAQDHKSSNTSHLNNTNYMYCRQEILGWLYLKARPTSKVSELFVHQLSLHACRIGDVYAGQWHHFHSHQILDAIAELDGKTDTHFTKRETPYRGKILRGLHHKHFFSPMFIAKNIENSVRRNAPELAKLVQERIATSPAGRPVDLDALIAYAATIDAFRLHAARKSGIDPKVTGECIVFKATNTGNVLLTLATHAESDEAIYERVLTARKTLFNVSELSLYADQQAQFDTRHEVRHGNIK
ncbi:MAG TPA: hypothetical protein VGV41_01635 [Pseudolabrys sp.]|uniref:hypothetical protein n=1 Tax=Pseudolabrys sp. TaxID=1960880 RepID=UPI002DDCA395|nr:hypothetical protein [Pseudolabrys sp.]HEV2627332.1 hypothetical protein [Pseudolabrys sp.]